MTVLYVSVCDRVEPHRPKQGFQEHVVEDSSDSEHALKGNQDAEHSTSALVLATAAMLTTSGKQLHRQEASVLFWPMRVLPCAEGLRGRALCTWLTLG